MLVRALRLDDGFGAVEARLSDAAGLADPNQLREASRRHKELAPIVERYRAYQARLDDLEAARTLFSESTGDDRESLVAVRLRDLETRLIALPAVVGAVLSLATPDEPSLACRLGFTRGRRRLPS